MDSQNFKTYYESKKAEVGKRAEDKLNSLPVEKRKYYFKLIFVMLMLFVVLRLFFALSGFGGKDEAEADCSVSEKSECADSLDILKIDLSVPKKEVPVRIEKGLRELLRVEAEKDSLEAYEK